VASMLLSSAMLLPGAVLCGPSAAATAFFSNSLPFLGSLSLPLACHGGVLCPCADGGDGVGGPCGVPAVYQGKDLAKDA